MAEAWSYIQQGKTLGPVTEDALKGLLAIGQLGPDDLVWHQGLTEWTLAGLCPELQPARIALDLPPALPPPPIAPTPIFPPNPFAMGEAAPSARSAKAAVAGAIENLRATRPWVRFLGVLGILGTILMAVVAVVLLGITSAGPLRGMPTGLRMVIPVVYLFLAALQVPPVLYLNRYASRIADLQRSEAPEDLVRALQAQKSFWKYVGIMTLIMLIFYVLIFAGGLVVALVGGAKHWF